MSSINELLPLNSVCLAAEKGKALTRILLVKDGDPGWAGLDGFNMDQETADRIIAAFTAHGSDIPIDYHHSTTKMERGQVAKAPAAGWIKRLEYVKGEGLFAAEIEWTEAARDEIESKQYKYVSPVVAFNTKTKAMHGIHSVALTNTPQTMDAPALLAAQKEMFMQDKLKLWVAGVQADVLRIEAQDDGADMPAIDDTTKAIADLIQALKGAGMEMEPGATLTTVLIAAAEFVAQNTEGVEAPEGTEEEEPPVEAEKVTTDATELQAKIKAGNYDRLEAEVKELRENADRVEAEKKSTRVDALLQGVIDSNRLNPNATEAVEAARALAETDEAGFEKMFAGIEPYAPVGQHTKDSKAGRNARERAIIEASREYDEDGMMHTAGAASKRSYVDVVLGETGETELTDAESEKLEVVS